MMLQICSSVHFHFSTFPLPLLSSSLLYSRHPIRLRRTGTLHSSAGMLFRNLNSQIYASLPLSRSHCVGSLTLVFFFLSIVFLFSVLVSKFRVSLFHILVLSFAEVISF